MSSRLSPFDTASLCSWLSLSMKVTHSSSPGFGGSTWPCRVDGVEENDRTNSGRAGRINRGKPWRFDEVVRALDIVTGVVLELPKRRRHGGEGICDEEGRRRVKARANVRGAAMAVRGEECGDGQGEGEGEERGEEEEEAIREKTEGWWGFLRLDIGIGELQLEIVLPRQQQRKPGLEAANARVRQSGVVGAINALR